MPVVSVLLMVACRGGDALAPAPASLSAVRVVVAHPTSGSEQLAYDGTVEAEDSVEIRPETSGPIVAVSFGDGQQVSKGGVLVRLRDTSARAAVDDAEARLALAKVQLERTRALFDRQNASRADVDKAEADEALARAAVDRAREALRQTVIRAPFDGVLGLRRVSPGDVVDPGRVVTRIEALDRVVVDVEVPEREVTRIRTGQAASVAVDALPGQPFLGEVAYVAPRISSTTRTGTVRVRVPNPEARLEPGMSARVAVLVDAIPGALVPTEAVVSRATGSAVWVVKDDTVTLRPVDLAAREADAVRVVRGLEDGDRIVVEGLMRLRDGARVKVLDDAAPAAPGTAAP